MDAAAHAEGNASAPAELKFARYVKEWGMPGNGGWYDWPAGLADRAMVASNTARAFSLYNANKGHPKWVNANPQIFAIVTDVWTMRKEAGMEWW